MASSSLCFISFLCFVLYHGALKLQASHHFYTAQASRLLLHHHEQPYRTSYHFQPPKNWINGLSLSLSFSFLFFSVFFLVLNVSIFFFVISIWVWNCLHNHRSKWFVHLYSVFFFFFFFNCYLNGN